MDRDKDKIISDLQGIVVRQAERQANPPIMFSHGTRIVYLHSDVENAGTAGFFIGFISGAVLSIFIGGVI